MLLLNFLQKKGIVLIIVFYLIVGSIGIFFNYPLFNTVGDEAPLLSATLKMISDHSLRPNYPSFYHLPVGAYLYLPFFIIILILMRISGMFSSLDAIKEFGQIEFAKFLPLARFISVLSGAVCVYLVYKICEKLFNNKFISLAAAFLLSVSLLFVQTSHFAKIWLPQTLTILLAFYFIVSLFQSQREKLKDYLWCGLTIALAFGTHVVGIFIYASFLAVHYLKHKKEKLSNIIFHRLFWSANFLFIILYFIIYYLNTYGFVRYLGGAFPNLNSMLSLSGTFSPVVDRIEPLVENQTSISSHIWYYINILWQYEPLLVLLAVFGSIILFIKKRDVFIIIYSFIIVYFLGISSISIKGARMILPVVPFMAIISAYGLAWLYYKVNYKKFTGILIGILFIFLLYPPLLWDYKFILPSSRPEAMKWIYQNIPSGESIINLDAYLELNENKQSLGDIGKYTNFLTKKRAYLLNFNSQDLPRPNYYIFFYPHYNEVPPEILAKEFNYAIISWWDKNDLENSLAKLEEFNLNSQNLALIKRFPDWADENTTSIDISSTLDNPWVNLSKLRHNGPVVDVYQIN
ncbi:MAG: glycosyltransferase family 39 protein [Patescibacteria group bacterium]|jgi:hypothetical protein